ncbi:IS4 family transposase [Micromonospora sp. CPCC 206060]|uniref:IS4 family transposase n=1 Tax=Micromonospora sp. CPCC 206060 TaxID=3122406 RepID=UPI002FEEB979
MEPLRPRGRLTDHIGLGVVSARFNRDLLEEVLNRSQRREKRVRRLPAHVMIRYVIAMGLFCAESYDEVMRRLVGNLRRLGSWDDDWQVPTASAITQARQRLGAEPVKMLFDRACVPLAGPGTKGAWLARRRLMAIDATSFDVADTPANAERFGRTGSGPKASAYPKLHVAVLAECGSHAIVGAVLGSCRTGERTLIKDLAPRVGPGMLVLADAGLYSFDLFDSFAATGADLAWRIGASVSIGHLRWLADGSYQALIFKAGLSAERRARLVEQARTGQEIPTGLGGDAARLRRADRARADRCSVRRRSVRRPGVERRRRHRAGGRDTRRTTGARHHRLQTRQLRRHSARLHPRRNGDRVDQRDMDGCRDQRGHACSRCVGNHQPHYLPWGHPVT